MWRRLLSLETVRQQQSAFACATGLPLTVLPAQAGEVGDLPQGLGCSDGCFQNTPKDRCRRALERAERRIGHGSNPVQYRCPIGLVKIVAPVRLGGQHVANLVAGPFSPHRLTDAHLTQLARRLSTTGWRGSLDRLRTAWRFSPVAHSARGQALMTLVRLFARFLSDSGVQLLRKSQRLHSPLLQQVEAVLRQRGEDGLSVRELAAQVRLSPCQFCKLFKRQTGSTFTRYQLQRRLELAQLLLRNPHARISEAAFQAGFSSIPYFNRAFRRSFGCSPTEFRDSPPGEIGAKKTTKST